MSIEIVVLAELVSLNGDDRLRLMGERRGDETDFRALLLQRRAQGQWITRQEIGAAAFQGGRASRRWVSDLHSFRPHAGTAIIQVAEADWPWRGGTHMVSYSWRRWHLLENAELARLKDCASPWEPL